MLDLPYTYQRPVLRHEEFAGRLLRRIYRVCYPKEYPFIFEEDEGNKIFTLKTIKEFNRSEIERELEELVSSKDIGTDEYLQRLKNIKTKLTA